eukprot:Lithocolla_globosa_v1_NODE_4558_length_1410_cov_11.761624.p1 type:complete len:446 gc:universal NODE_4558_length_1410_cov_11.761624:1353-16(-)
MGDRSTQVLELDESLGKDSDTPSVHSKKSQTKVTIEECPVDGTHKTAEVSLKPKKKKKKKKKKENVLSDESDMERPDNSRTDSYGMDIDQFKLKVVEEEQGGTFGKLPDKIKDFYRQQNQQIHEYDKLRSLGIDEEAMKAEEELSEADQRHERQVAYLSAGTNFFLLVMLVTAVSISGSLAILASVVDSALDILSSLVILATSKAKRNVNFYKYPQGRERVEPVGVLVFASIMGTASLMVIVESLRTLMENEGHAPELTILVIALVATDVFLKCCLFLYCRMYADRILIAEALTQDHRNDVMVNTVVLLSAFLASKYWPPLDPIGAILVSSWTCYNWSSTSLDQVKLLTGRAASPDFLKQLTWICLNHDERIDAVDTVRAFHFGTRYLVEIDICLPPQMVLQTAHDIGESLQQKVELLADVERCFVHLDFETDHNPTTEHKQWGQ